MQKFLNKFKHKLIGAAKNPKDHRVFHSLSLIPFLAWVGLGSDGLSSSCYGPEEAYRALGSHPYLSVFIALASAGTIFIISQSYKQIIQLFPTGGGGYLVASKLLGPKTGMVSGCALLIDYVLTISISIASGASAIFSFLPPEWYVFRIEFAVAGLVLLTLANVRGIKEAVVPLVPLFLLFVILHLFAILYTLFTHAPEIAPVYTHAVSELNVSYNELGFWGVLFLIMKAYSMGAGTYTGIEAVSNGLPILRDPKVITAQKTMNYMAISLAVTVVGLMFAYLLFDVKPVEGRTLNAILFSKMSVDWNPQAAYAFIFAILFSEAVLLFIAAQAGFLDGPRVLASMALDKWFPTKFAHLSNRLVNQNGILLMGVTALVMLVVSGGSVGFLVVLYSINVFITFSLSQLGMVKHWWEVRKVERGWRSKLIINGIGLFLTAFILLSVIIIKFSEGGWITIIVTGSLIIAAMFIKKHYNLAANRLKRLDSIVESVMITHPDIQEKSADAEASKVAFNPQSKTAVVLVNGFNGLGLHTLFNSIRLFSGIFKNYIFIQIGSIDAGNFKGVDEVHQLEEYIRKEANSYVKFMNANGYYAKAITKISTDVIEEIVSIGEVLNKEYENLVFFGGQLVFAEETFLSRQLHNYVVFEVQRQFYYQGIPFVILPIRLTDTNTEKGTALV